MISRQSCRVARKMMIHPLLCVCASNTSPTKHVLQTSKSTWYIQQPTWRYWGEEKSDGGVYSVYLKKVRYHRPSKSILSHESTPEDEISHLEWETVRVRFIKAGTLDSLVDSLASDDGELESTYINVFLATYRTFASSGQVLHLLIQRFEQISNNKLDLPDAVREQHRKTMILALHVWLDSYPEDFRDSPNHKRLQRLYAFCKSYLPGSELELKVCHRLEKFKKEDQCQESPIIKQLLHTASKEKMNGEHSYNFMDISERHFAEQLTFIDMELFKKLIPHQCLGAVWSKKDKDRGHKAATVLATINQFNAVSFRVISTVVVDHDLRPLERSKIVGKWIDIAQELRVLKNFSSLKAIISGLQSNPVFRLRKVWQMVAREKVELFEELARIFSEDNNQMAQRELLMKEGTAKFADTVGENDRQLQKVILRQTNNNGICHGTVPYLGTFLTDLTMIDTAIPDTVCDGLINFDKRRKEFEVLAQIKLLQGAANTYSIEKDEAFERWFDSLLVLDDREAHDLSCQIDPPGGSTNSGSSAKGQHGRSKLGHRKTDSLASTTSSSSSSQFYCDVESLLSSQDVTPDRKAAHSRMSSSSSSSSLPSLDISVGSANSANMKPVETSTPNHKSNSTQDSNPYKTADFYIIRVSVESNTAESDGVVMYKSIVLGNHERTPQVIQNAMQKLGLTGSIEDYVLAQVLPNNGEMVLPSNANVYYAINTAYDLNFVLKCKTQTDLANSANGGVSKKLKEKPLKKIITLGL